MTIDQGSSRPALDWRVIRVLVIQCARGASPSIGAEIGDRGAGCPAEERPSPAESLPEGSPGPTVEFWT